MTAQVRRAGILTLWDLSNFGNRLQNYAVHTLLESRGYEAWTLLAAPRHYRNPINAMRQVRAALRRGTLDRHRFARFCQFERLMHRRRFWSRRHLGFTRRTFDCFIVGSDQIWNPRFVHLDGHLFLDWADRHQRIALAPSFGISQLSANLAPLYATGLNGFERLSVREDAGGRIIASLTGKEATVLIDPTLALSASEWRAVACSALRPRAPYVLTYFLGACPDGIRDFIKQVSGSRSLSVVNLLDTADPGTYEAGPAEFLDLIDNAECVFTDSFHGSAFSLLFDVPVTIFERRSREGDSHSMHSRIDTFVRTFGLEGRLHSKAQLSNVFAADYDGAQEILEVKRGEFLAFLDEELERSRQGGTGLVAASSVLTTRKQ